MGKTSEVPITSTVEISSFRGCCSVQTVVSPFDCQVKDGSFVSRIHFSNASGVHLEHIYMTLPRGRRVAIPLLSLIRYLKPPFLANRSSGRVRSERESSHILPRTYLTFWYYVLHMGSKFPHRVSRSSTLANYSTSWKQDRYEVLQKNRFELN